MQTLEDLQDRLKSVRKAINLIETNGQETELQVGANRRNIVRGSLKDLYAEEKHLIRQIDRLEGRGLTLGIPT
jgi:hypothetical protein